jgi:hypothetical protein
MAQDKTMDADADSQGDEVQFPIPKGYNPPAHAKDGKEFSAVATFRIDDDDDEDNKENGPMLVLTKIEGVPVSSEAPEEEEEEGSETSPEMLSALSQPEATNASSGMPASATY